MKLYIKQKVFSWNDKFSVYDANGEERYFVEGEFFSWGKKLHVYNIHGEEVAFIKQQVFSFLPKFFVFCGERQVAEIKKEFTFFRQKYTVAGLDWDVDGNMWAHNYDITKNGSHIVSINKEWMTWGDSYELDIAEGEDEIVALAVVLTIDCVVEAQRNN